MKKVALLVFMLILGKIYANNPEILVLDKENKEPIPYANICFEEVKTKKKYYEITSFEGIADNPVKNESVVVVSFVGYKTIKDTIKENDSKKYFLESDIFNIEQVVVTGESVPVVTDKSIYKIKVIPAKKIEQMGAATLEEVLFNEANIRITSDLVLGSQIEMMGLDGYNVKVMIDGIPMIGRLGGNLDLSQVNVANVNHIEIIEGPMSVIYGNNAMAGTINIITKKGAAHNFNGRINTQAESVEKYTADVLISANTDIGTFAFEGGLSDFNGVDFNESNRSIDWKPKTQYRGSISNYFVSNNWEWNTKFNGYYDKLLSKGNITYGTDPETGEPLVFAQDETFFTQRYSASLGVKNNWNEKNDIDILAAYSYYDRSSQVETIDLTTLDKNIGDKSSSQDNQQYMLRASYMRSLPLINLSVQSGFDGNIEKMGGPRMLKGEEQLGDYALFLNLKYNIFPQLEFQPGLRYAYNTDYDTKTTYAFNLKWDISQNLTWRGSMARGYRAPTLKELYYLFVNSNHNINGNPNLKPENSYNYNTSLIFKNTKIQHKLLVSFSAYYNNVDDRIDLVQQTGSSKYIYDNIHHYESTGGDIDLKYAFKNFLKFSIGYGPTGRYNQYTEENNSETFFFSHDAFSSLEIFEPKSRLRFFADYKYNGIKPYLFSDEDDEGNEVISEGEQEDYHTLNMSLSRKFLKNTVNVTFAAKNIFDVTSVRLTEGSSGGGHSSGGNVPLLYGRSFMIKLSYNLIK